MQDSVRKFAKFHLKKLCSEASDKLRNVFYCSSGGGYAISAIAIASRASFQKSPQPSDGFAPQPDRFSSKVRLNVLKFCDGLEKNGVVRSIENIFLP